MPVFTGKDIELRQRSKPLRLQLAKGGSLKKENGFALRVYVR
jgi:hypothetical protein